MVFHSLPRVFSQNRAGVSFTLCAGSLQYDRGTHGVGPTVVALHASKHRPEAVVPKSFTVFSVFCFFCVSHHDPPGRGKVSSYTETLHPPAAVVKKIDGRSLGVAVRLRDDFLATPSTAAERRRLNEWTDLQTLADCLSSERLPKMPELALQNVLAPLH